MLLEKELLRCLERNVQLEFLVGLDFGTTDGKALRWFRAMANKTDKLHFYCFRDPLKEAGPTFHPKLYLLKRGSFGTAIMGSSNLTRGGLKENVELNVILRDRYDSEAVNAVSDIYVDFKYRGNPFTPDESYIEGYEEVTRHVRKARDKTLSLKSTAKMMASLGEKEERLPRPTIPDPSSLTGWQGLVYEKIPPGEFTTKSMYRFVEEFREAYPRNRYVEDKIRQILQQLRDDGFIEPLGRGRWIKRAVE
jgi:HKD family nuclease